MGRLLDRVKVSTTASVPTDTLVMCCEVSEVSEVSPWGKLLADAGPLRGTLDAFRAQGCALTVVGGRVLFGPYDDFEGCAWRNADEWHAAYAVALAPHELTLKDLLARLLEQIETEDVAQ